MLFEMIYHEAAAGYVYFLTLSLIATVIASQAMISGIFSIVYQGIATHLMPLFRVEYTSSKLKSKIYIASVNRFLFAAVVLIIFDFQESIRLAAACGLAVTGTMTITGILMPWIFRLKGQSTKSLISMSVTLVDIVFLSSNPLTRSLTEDIGR